MRAEHVKEWLRGIRREEDPKRAGGSPGDGDHWRLFVQLVQAVWTHGEIPCQLLGWGGLPWHRVPGTHLEGD